MNDRVAETALATADIQRIMQLIPHRYPFLMIDRVTEMVAGQSAVGRKNVTINEPHFQGHFPARPIMPGVLIVEAMAQTAATLVVATLGPDAEGRIVYFMTVDRCRFRRPVVPGDVLRVPVRVLRARGNVWKFHGRAEVEGQLAAEAEFSAMIVDS